MPTPEDRAARAEMIAEEGLRVRLDVFCLDAEDAARVIDSLGRIAVGYASEGLVSGLLVSAPIDEVETSFTIEDDEGDP